MVLGCFDIGDEELQEEFNVYRMTFQSQDVMDQMKVLCAKFQLSLEDMCDEFVAHIRNLMAKSKSQATVITADHLLKFEAARDNAKPSVSSPLSKTPNIKDQSFRTPSSVHRPTNKSFSSSANPNLSGRNQEAPLLTGQIDFSEAGERRSAKKPEKPTLPFCDRKNKGEVMAALGKLPDGMSWNKLPKASTPVTLNPKDRSTCLSEPYPFMFVRNQEVALALNSNIDELADEIAIANSITEYASPTVIGDKTAILGRLLPAGLEGGLNLRNLWLQASSTFHNGAKGRVDIELTKRFSLFPGQVVACTGHGNGSAFAVDQIFHGAIPQSVKVDIAHTDTLHLLVACGPFNIIGQSHDPQPEPLRELIKYIEQSKPDLVILLGPFVDGKQLAQDEEYLTECNLDDHFKSMATFIIKEIVTRLNVHLVMVPSAGQIVPGMPVYPVPRLSLSECVENAHLFGDFYRQIIFVPEPALLEVNGIVLALTSTDIISHLCQKEVSKGMCDDRLPRLAGHLLQQRSFYPLYPTEVPADIAALQKYAKIRCKPHILITPSDMKGFLKMVHGTVCLNPERLVKGYTGGTFARLFIPTAPENGEGGVADTLEGRIAAEIVRI